MQRIHEADFHRVGAIGQLFIPLGMRGENVIKIDVWINDRQIATAHGVNVSELASLSDYEIEAVSEASSVTGVGSQIHRFQIRGHLREQSAWALVAKIAQEAAQQEGTPPT